MKIPENIYPKDKNVKYENVTETQEYIDALMDLWQDEDFGDNTDDCIENFPLVGLG